MATSRARMKVSGAAFAGLLLLAGCSVANDDPVDVAAEQPAPSSTTTAPPAEGAADLSASAKATAATPSVRVVGSASIRLGDIFRDGRPEGDFSLELGLTAALDREQDRAHITADIESSGSFGGFRVPSATEAIFDGKDIYVRSGFGGPVGRWRKATLRKGGAADVMGAANLTDPDTYLSLLEEANAPVTSVGREDVGGVTTTHKRAVIDVASTKGMSKKAAEQVERTLERLGLTGSKSPKAPFDIWVGDDGLIRRIRAEMKLDIRLDEGGAAPQVAVELVFSDFGARPDITLPAKSDVDEVDPDDLMGN